MAKLSPLKTPNTGRLNFNPLKHSTDIPKLSLNDEIQIRPKSSTIKLNSVIIEAKEDLLD